MAFNKIFIISIKLNVHIVPIGGKLCVRRVEGTANGKRDSKLGKVTQNCDRVKGKLIRGG